jgi:putative transposase
MDLYSRRIVGWSMRDDLEAPLVVDAISMAISRRRPEPGLVHHSDRLAIHLDRDGPYATRLRRDGEHGLQRRPWDNACAESCISTIKNELVKRRTFVTRDQARLALFRYIESFTTR